MRNIFVSAYFHPFFAEIVFMGTYGPPYKRAKLWIFSESKAFLEDKQK